MIKSTREGLLLCLAFSAGSGSMSLLAGLPWPISAACAAASIGLLIRLLRNPAEPEQLGVWAHQRRLMAASGQSLPRTPTMSHTFLLYLALCAEELSETFDAALLVMSNQRLNLVADHQLVELAEELRTASEGMRHSALNVRLKLTRIAPAAIDWPMTVKEAVGVLDGLSDLVVTTTGAAEAAGLPGAAGYVEVQESNWSKTNPLTWVIDKTPDGKWIKGTAYRPPDLESVVVSHVALAAISLRESTPRDPDHSDRTW